VHKCANVAWHPPGLTGGPQLAAPACGSARSCLVGRMLSHHGHEDSIVTSIACWVGVDSHGPASVYLATDSRISWPNQAGTWDYGRKCFASSTSPDIFAYSGDVLFASMFLSQFVGLLEGGAVPGNTFDSRTRALEAMARITFKPLLATYESMFGQGAVFDLIHCGRDGLGSAAAFRIAVLQCSPNGGWRRHMVPIPDGSSKMVFVTGTGAPVVRTKRSMWERCPGGGTSRAIYSAFVEAINSGADPRSGGAPQLVGLYRGKGNGMAFGTVVKRRRYLNGVPVTSRLCSSVLEWRNERFERCDGRTGRRLQGAQLHSRPPMEL
jgi:hypothetical protein